jgi:hypothetical protein
MSGYTCASLIRRPVRDHYEREVRGTQRGRADGGRGLRPARHGKAEFLDFFKRIAKSYPRRELHVVLDNSHTHKHDDINRWLVKDPRVTLHCTLTSGSWLNLAEVRAAREALVRARLATHLRAPAGTRGGACCARVGGKAATDAQRQLFSLVIAGP